MKTVIFTGAFVVMALTIGVNQARAQCYWSASGYQCPRSSQYSQADFGFGNRVGSGAAATRDDPRLGLQPGRNLRPDSGYPGPPLIGGGN